MSYPENKNFKYTPEERAAMRLIQKAYRRHKKMEVAELRARAASTVTTNEPASEPVTEACYKI